MSIPPTLQLYSRIKYGRVKHTLNPLSLQLVVKIPSDGGLVYA
jgi:hypothetical protein